MNTRAGKPLGVTFIEWHKDFRFIWKHNCDTRRCEGWKSGNLSGGNLRTRNDIFDDSRRAIILQAY